MPRVALLLLSLCAIFATIFAFPVNHDLDHLELFNATSKRSIYAGTSTYYYVGLGACGYQDVDSSHIVALGQNHYTGSCNRWIHVLNTSNGKTVTAQVRDLCESCTNSDRIDLSPSAFQTIGPESEGVLPVQWYYI